MSDPVQPFVPTFLSHLKDVPRHFPIAALADRSFEYGRIALEHIPDHYIVLHTMVEAIRHVPSPVVWAVCFAGTMALEVFYHDAMDEFYHRIAHSAHKTLHRMPGGAKAAHVARTHHTKLTRRVGAYVTKMGEQLEGLGQFISGPRHGGHHGGFVHA